MKKCLSLLAIAGSIAAAAPAMAATYPASVVGGPWTWGANQSQVVVTIRSQATGAVCEQILGTMQAAGTANIADVQGYYCPSTGRISMLRKDHASQATYQVFSGQVDAVPTLSQAYVGGTFLSISTGFNAGEFSFAGRFTN
jgi:hypothetical protein